MIDRFMASLEDICELAMKEGKKIDLSDCPYGETTGSCSFINRPAKYYYFLAGFVKSLGLTTILEIGTNYGGSIMSMSRGIPDDSKKNSCLVTVDVFTKNVDGFMKYPQVKRIEGDSLDENVIKKVGGLFKGTIDLIYLDAVHEYKHTRDNIELYSKLLNPRYLILDDIRLSGDMERLWEELREEYGNEAFDASEVSIRRGAGFGVVRARS